MAGSARDLRHGEEHRAAEEMHSGQGGAHAGRADPPRHQDTPPQRRGLPGPRTAQVTSSVHRRIYSKFCLTEFLLCCSNVF